MIVIGHVFVIVAFIVIVSLNCGGAFAQTGESSKSPQFRLTISTYKTDFKIDQPFVSKVVIENLDVSSTSINLPTAAYFHLSSPVPEPAVVYNGQSYWSPVSLTKKYLPTGKGCQSDLSDDRVKSEGGVVTISPARGNLVLNKGDKMEFEFDLATTCWNPEISSFWPDRRLSNLAQPGSYTLYCAMEFDDGVGSSQETSSHVKSNEIKVLIEK